MTGLWFLVERAINDTIIFCRSFLLWVTDRTDGDFCNLRVFILKVVRRTDGDLCNLRAFILKVVRRTDGDFVISGHLFLKS